jgi:hypothetical protein
MRFIMSESEVKEQEATESAAEEQMPDSSEETEQKESTEAEEPTDESARDLSSELEDLEAPNIFAEFFLFLREEKIWWMAPMLVVLLLVGVLLIFGQSAPALAPFIYPLF